MGLGQRLVLNYIRTKFKFLSIISKSKAAKKAFQLFLTPQQRRKKDLPPIFNEAENLEFSLKNNKIRGYRWNYPSKDKILILHGYESSVVNFSHFINALIDKNFEVLAFDAPAHGNSDGKMIDVLLYKDMIRLIYENYGPVKSFIAHSFGGLALSLTIEEIEHDASFKIVLIAPATETKRAIDNFFNFLKLDQKVRLEFERLLTEAGNNIPSWYSITRAAKNFKAQVLFLQDENDNLTPLSDVVPIINKKYPNFHFIISKGLGHRRIYKDDNSFKAIMDFL